MLNKLIIITGILSISINVIGQNVAIDSLYLQLSKVQSDPEKYKQYLNLYIYYNMHNRDSALYYCDQRILLAKKNNDALAIANALAHKSFQLNVYGQYGKALECLLSALEIAEDRANEKSTMEFNNNSKGLINRLQTLNNVHYHLGHLFGSTFDRKEQIYHYRIAYNLAKQTNDLHRIFFCNLSLGRVYMEENKLDSALVFLFEAEKYTDIKSGFNGALYHQFGKVYYLKGDSKKAKLYLYKGIQKSTNESNLTTLIRNYYELTNIFLNESERDSSLYYALKSLDVSNSMGSAIYTGYDFGMICSNIYRAYDLLNQQDSSYKYLRLAIIAKDSIHQIRIKNLADYQKVNIGQKLQLLQLEKEQAKSESKFRMYVAISSIGVLMIISVVYYRIISIKKKASTRLQKAYTELKTTQNQLIQSEKMSSLGELTAGIAHEIQNPLNFVNNFSEVNNELIDELKAESTKPKSDWDESLIKDTLNNLKDNEQKIVHHGKRADAIVKSMLQHSRTSSGKKELTDINALCDEYLRLSYHGLRAKDKSFNAKFETHLDPTLPKLNVIPQDIGRVLLNLINNAFYAVNERIKRETADVKSEQSHVSPLTSHYEPTVIVSTKSLGDKIEISVKDNGNGIPDSIKEKIFQPFFTTKPTGQGTGLGLSLCYDILKAHGGEIKVNSKENEGTEFIVTL